MRRFTWALTIILGASHCSGDTTNGDQAEGDGAEQGQDDTVDGDEDTGDAGATDGTGGTGTGGESDDGGTEPETWAHVLSVTVSGNENAYTFGVEIHSSDTGCEQYCNWWEVLTPEGELLYRRILDHAHLEDGTSGNPFVRSGGPVPIAADQEVIVRGHHNTAGYEGMDFRGTVNDGFVEAPELGPDFASSLEDEEPLPTGCNPDAT